MRPHLFPRPCWPPTRGPAQPTGQAEGSNRPPPLPLKPSQPSKGSPVSAQPPLPVPPGVVPVLPLGLPLPRGLGPGWVLLFSSRASPVSSPRSFPTGVRAPTAPVPPLALASPTGLFPPGHSFIPPNHSFCADVLGLYSAGCCSQDWKHRTDGSPCYPGLTLPELSLILRSNDLVYSTMCSWTYASAWH